MKHVFTEHRCRRAGEPKIAKVNGRRRWIDCNDEDDTQGKSQE
jgi:hypothetical protein